MLGLFHTEFETRRERVKILAEHGEQCETYKTAKNYLETRADYTDDTSCLGSDELEELAQDFRESLAEDYRMILSREYDYQTSEEQIRESLIANDYEFTEEGKIYR